MVKNSLRKKALVGVIAATITAAGIAQAALASTLADYGADVTNSVVYRSGFAWTRRDTGGMVRAKISIGGDLSDIIDYSYVQTTRVAGMRWQSAYIGHGTEAGIIIAYTK